MKSQREITPRILVKKHSDRTDWNMDFGLLKDAMNDFFNLFGNAGKIFSTYLGNIDGVVVVYPEKFEKIRYEVGNGLCYEIFVIDTEHGIKVPIVASNISFGKNGEVVFEKTPCRIDGKYVEIPEGTTKHADLMQYYTDIFLSNLASSIKSSKASSSGAIKETSAP